MRFPRQVIALFTEAIHLHNRGLRGEVPLAPMEAARSRFGERLFELASRRRTEPEHQRLADHLWNHLQSWFGFLTEPELPATWGGNRTWAGRKPKRS